MIGEIGHASSLRNRQMLNGVFLSDLPERVNLVWGPAQRKRLRSLVNISDCIVTSESIVEHQEWLQEVDVVFSTWGMPRLNSELLDMMPRLKAVFYAAGSVRDFAGPLLDREIIVVSAREANAIPVAEFTLAQILISLKLGWLHVRGLRENPALGNWRHPNVPGGYHSTVGVIALGAIGRKLCELLKPFSIHLLAHDPLATVETFEKCRATSVDLDTIFSKSDAVTLHAPLLPETKGIINGNLLRKMKPNATFINTSRGALVCESELIEVLQQRLDLTAVLDVTHPSPSDPASPLHRLPNVIMTPHIAGSLGRETWRMADLMIDEFEAYSEGRALQHALNQEMLLHSA